MLKIILSNFRRKGDSLTRSEEQIIVQKVIDLLYVEGLEFDLKIEDVESMD